MLHRTRPHQRRLQDPAPGAGGCRARRLAGVVSRRGTRTSGAALLVPFPRRSSKRLCSGRHRGDPRPRRLHRNYLTLPRRALRRSLFDAWMAKSSGAELLEGTEVYDFDAIRFENRIRGRNVTGRSWSSSPYLVGADGAASTTLQSLRPEFSRIYQQPNLVRFVELDLPRRPPGAGACAAGVLLLARPAGPPRVLSGPGGLHPLHTPEAKSAGRTCCPPPCPCCASTSDWKRRSRQASASASLIAWGNSRQPQPGAGSVLAGEASGLADPWGRHRHGPGERGVGGRDHRGRRGGEDPAPRPL